MKVKYNIVLFLAIAVYICGVTANCPTDPQGIYSKVIGLFLYNITVVLFVFTNYFL